MRLRDVCHWVASKVMSHSGLLDGEGPGPVIAVPQRTRADPNVHYVAIMGTFHAVWVLGEVGLQTAIAVGARRNVGRPLALHGHLVVPADDQPQGGSGCGTSESFGSCRRLTRLVESR
jgi:hypothetical protein